MSGVRKMLVGDAKVYVFLDCLMDLKDYVCDVRVSEQGGKLCVFYDDVIYRFTPSDNGTKPPITKQVVPGSDVCIIQFMAYRKVKIHLMCGDIDYWRSHIVDPLAGTAGHGHNNALNYDLPPIPESFFDEYLVLDL